MLEFLHVVFPMPYKHQPPITNLYKHTISQANFLYVNFDIPRPVSPEIIKRKKGSKFVFKNVIYKEIIIKIEIVEINKLQSFKRQIDDFDVENKLNRQ